MRSVLQRQPPARGTRVTEAPKKSSGKKPVGPFPPLRRAEAHGAGESLAEVAPDILPSCASENLLVAP
jgi:hypothetical protein